jgi:hypothetical protein
MIEAIGLFLALSGYVAIFGWVMVGGVLVIAIIVLWLAWLFSRHNQ